MQRLKLLGLALIAVFAFAAVAASVASAEAPGINILPDSNEGAAGMKFSFASTAGEKTVLQMVGSTEKIECEKVSGKGEATSDPLGKVEFKFEGCKSSGLGVSCTGEKAGEPTGQILVEKAEYHIRKLLANSDVQIVILLGETVKFKCTALASLTVKGCVSSMDLEKTKGTLLGDELVKSFFANFLQTNGVQEITSIDNEAGTAMETCVLKSTKNGGAETESGQLGSGTVEKFEKGGKETEVLFMA